MCPYNVGEIIMADRELTEIISAFTSGDVFTAKDEVLSAYLAKIIDRDHYKALEVDGRLRPEVVPAMVGIIVSIRSERTSKALAEAQDALAKKNIELQAEMVNLTRGIYFLTIVIVAATAIQIYLTFCR